MSKDRKPLNRKIRDNNSSLICNNNYSDNFRNMPSQKATKLFSAVSNKNILNKKPMFLYFINN